MMSEPKTKEEWQELVNDFSPEKQSKKDYCKERDIKYNAFRNWYFKLKSNTGLIKKERAESKLGVSEVKKELPNKEFIGFRLVSNVTKINLPNGINVEVATGDVIELIRKLLHVA